ncbi:MAG TPA: hypothetical protein VGD95_04000, partial [Micavibrio sp.]
MMKNLTCTDLIRHSSMVVLALTASVLHAPAPAHAVDMPLAAWAGSMTESLSRGTLGAVQPAVAAHDNPATLYKVNSAGSGAESFIGDMAGRALQFLGSGNMNQDQKVSSFRTLLNDS